jgi:hypothetical protein
MAREDTMPETTNEHLEGTLKQLLQERAELDSLIAGLQKRLGKSVTVAATGLSMNISEAGGTKPVYRGAFFNLSITKAAEKVLKSSGIPLKTPQIMEIFDQAGYVVKGKTPRASIYTALARSKDFVKVLPDTWDLSERHPEAAAQKEQELRDTKAGGKRKRRAVRKPKVAAVPEKAEGIKSVA